MFGALTAPRYSRAPAAQHQGTVNDLYRRPSRNRSSCSTMSSRIGELEGGPDSEHGRRDRRRRRRRSPPGEFAPLNRIGDEVGAQMVDRRRDHAAGLQGGLSRLCRGRLGDAGRRRTNMAGRGCR